ncbi:hypothetical protein VP01_145g3 [Puccinia sorghi]|uniref:UEV domain-containing protein n=1 Tax=Puccinia sorghi TaxID=27349 RepID=A0A0L6VLQ3_9BASI|nr:hypothetical protein VP01_145g3 [Puccinia sorghi]
MLKWLTQALLPYPHKELALNHIQVALHQFTTLSPKTESFTFDDGRTTLLLALSGTIPVVYRALRYNLPIAIWFPFNYPFEPPIIYLTPTNDMIIKTSNNVDPNGKCLVNYLNLWQSKPEACSLIQLLQSLQDIFSNDPPLYSKPKQQAPPYSSSPPPPPPPPPTEKYPPPLPPKLETSESSTQQPNQNLLDDDPPDLTERNNLIPPPPRPPNPELLSLRQTLHHKLQNEIYRLKTSLHKEQQQLDILETDLLKGEPAIRDEIARLDAVNLVCLNVADRYRLLIDQLDKRFNDLTLHRRIVDVDELVCSTTVLYNQLWELGINDKVIQDILYHLSKALNNSMDGSKIDLDKFLKRVRVLGHEQFLIRANINHISRLLGFQLSSSTTTRITG